MTQTIETNLVDFLNRLDNNFDKLDNKIDKLDNKIDKLDNKIDRLTEDVNEIKVDIATLKEGQNGLSKRLENVEFINRYSHG